MILKYRPEIDGLRAIAVLGVIFYHVGVLFKGGFLGVDVFFVISGYLISLIILKELHANNTFSFLAFYERRARRIGPALSLIILISIFIAWFVMDGDQLEAYGLTLLAISGFASNIIFWQNSGYFAAPADMLPMLHTWSLAIEEQFYMVFPIFLIISWKYTHKYLLLIFTCLFLGSLTLAHWSSKNHVAPDAAFYLLHARCWELLAGAIIAKIELDIGRPTNKTLDHIMPAVGICLIAYSMLFYDKNTQHPSFFTLIPVAGSVIIIWFCKPGELVFDVLSSRVFVYTGLISYSLYLWHFPILVFSRLLNVGKLPANTNLWFFPLIFILSIATYKYVEIPFRNNEKFSKNKFVIYMTTAWSFIIIVGIVFVFNNGFPKRMMFPSSLEQSFLGETGNEKCLDSDFTSTADDWFCEISNYSDKPIDFIVTGDSHASSAIPAFRKFGDLNGLHGIVATHSACPPLLGINNIKNISSTEDGCSLLSDKIFNYVQEHGIKNIFFIAMWLKYIDNSGIQDAETRMEPANLSARLLLIKNRLEFTINKYAKIGVKVFLLGPVPIQKYSAKEIYKNVYLKQILMQETLENFHVKRSEHDRRHKDVVDLFNSQLNNNFKYLDITEYYCDKEICPVGTIDNSYYLDRDHLSPVGTDGLYRMLNNNRKFVAGSK